MTPIGEVIGKGNDVEQEHAADGGLVEQELHAAHLELLVIHSDPHRVDCARHDADEGKDDADGRRGLDLLVGSGPRVVVRHNGDSQAHWHKSVRGVPRDGRMIEDEVDQGHRRRQEDPSDLIEGHGGEGQRDVGQDDV